MKYAVLVMADNALDNDDSDMFDVYEQGQSYGLFDTFELAQEWVNVECNNKDFLIYPVDEPY